MHLVYPPKFYITIVSNFSWILQSFQKKSKIMVIQKNFFEERRGGESKVHYGLGENGQCAVSDLSQVLIVTRGFAARSFGLRQKIDRHRSIPPYARKKKNP